MALNFKRWRTRLVLGFVAAALIGAGTTVYLLKRPPAVWREAQQVLKDTTPQQRKLLARDVMRRLFNQDQAPQNSDGNEAQPGSGKHAGLLPGNARGNGTSFDKTYEVRMSNQELIAVASEMVEDWMTQRGYVMPTNLRSPVVVVENGQLTIAFELTSGAWSQVFSGRIELSFNPDGMAHGRVTELTAGSLPVSVVTIGDFLADNAPAAELTSVERAGEWIEQMESFEFRPVLELEDRSRLRVLDMQLEEESLVLTVRLQDGLTYKQHNELMKSGAVVVTDPLDSPYSDGSALVDVPTTTD